MTTATSGRADGDDACNGNSAAEFPVRVGMFELPADATQRQRAIVARLSGVMDVSFIEQTLIPLVQQASSLSLRSLDWLVTNYAKKFNIVCEVSGGGIFNIYHGYKTALSHFRRRNFDPFRRRMRIRMVFKGVAYETTVGQCNFFHWAHVNGVLAYAFDNAKNIESDMNGAAARHKMERKRLGDRGLPHRRRELSTPPITKCSVYNVHTRVSFRCVDE